jgi:hypothetical protein
MMLFKVAINQCYNTLNTMDAKYLAAMCRLRPYPNTREVQDAFRSPLSSSVKLVRNLRHIKFFKLCKSTAGNAVFRLEKNKF